MLFGFDPEKSAKLERQRGISLPFSARLFERDTVERPDLRRDYGEYRIKAIGRIDGIVYVSVYTWRFLPDETPYRWLITAWKANKRERLVHEAFFPGGGRPPQAH